ncbi:MAG: hypothetical protein AAF519_09600, partial [Bacteroidota bacterium]
MSHFGLNGPEDRYKTETIKALRAAHKKETKNTKDWRIAAVYQAQLKSIVKLVRANTFIFNDSMVREMEVMASRIIERNRLALDPPIILISKNHSPNAYTIGFNCIIFNVGLLARLKT